MMGQSDTTGQFDQFANQGGPAAEDADSLAEARRITDEQLRNADYSVDLPEPLGGQREGGDDLTAGAANAGAANAGFGGDLDAGSAGDPDAASAVDIDAASADGASAGDPDGASIGDPDSATSDVPDSASVGDPDAEAHARRLLAGEGAPIDDAPVTASRADAAEHADAAERSDD